MNQFNHSTYQQEVGSVEEEPRQRLRLECIGRAAIMWADPSVSKREVVAVTGLEARELRRLFGRRRHPSVCEI